jgi:cell division protein FtsZ
MIVVLERASLLEVHGRATRPMAEAFKAAPTTCSTRRGGIAEIINAARHTSTWSFADVRTVMWRARHGDDGDGSGVGRRSRAQHGGRAGGGLPAAGRTWTSTARAGRAGQHLGRARLAQPARVRSGHRHHPPVRLDDAHVIYGTAHDESSATPIRVTIVATGLGGALQRSSVQPPSSA